MLALGLTLLVAALHVVFFVFESLLWTSPGVRKRFGQTKEQAEATKVLAQNQGFYNLGIAVVLAWAALAGQTWAQLALLGFLVAMGIVGAVTAKGSILVVQSLPAAAALVATWLAR